MLSITRTVLPRKQQLCRSGRGTPHTPHYQHQYMVSHTEKIRCV